MHCTIFTCYFHMIHRKMLNAFHTYSESERKIHACIPVNEKPSDIVKILRMGSNILPILYESALKVAWYNVFVQLVKAIS